MSMFKKGAKVSAPKPCTGCGVMKWVSAALFLLTTIASLVGVYMSHAMEDGWMFGSTNGSLSIVAFVLSLTMLSKYVRKLCPCGTGCCGTC